MRYVTLMGTRRKRFSEQERKRSATYTWITIYLRGGTFSRGVTRRSRPYFIYSLYSVLYSIPFSPILFHFGPQSFLCTSPLTMLGNYVTHQAPSTLVRMQTTSRNFVTRKMAMQFVRVPSNFFFPFPSDKTPRDFLAFVRPVIKSKDLALRG